MADIKINILDFCGNNHWHYEIVINGERFLSGWYTYDLPFKYFDRYVNTENYPGEITKSQLKRLNERYALVEVINNYWARCFTHEAIDLVKGKIYESYYNILKNK